MGAGLSIKRKVITKDTKTNDRSINFKQHKNTSIIGKTGKKKYEDQIYLKLAKANIKQMTI